MNKFFAFRTNRYSYNVKEALDASITVGELIERLEELPRDAKIVFSNDGGFTYGNIKPETVYESELFEEEEEDPVMTRADMLKDIYDKIFRNGGKPVPCGCVWLGDSDVELQSVSYDDKLVHGANGSDGKFYPFEEMDDELIDEIWFNTTQIRRYK